MKRKLISMLLVAVLLTTVAVPALASIYYPNRSCPVCGIKGQWYRCSGMKLNHGYYNHTVDGSLCLYTESYYITYVDCGYGCGTNTNGTHYECETHQICFGGQPQYDCRV